MLIRLALQASNMSRKKAGSKFALAGRAMLGSLKGPVLVSSGDLMSTFGVDVTQIITG